VPACHLQVEAASSSQVGTSSPACLPATVEDRSAIGRRGVTAVTKKWAAPTRHGGLPISGSTCPTFETDHWVDARTAAARIDTLMATLPPALQSPAGGSPAARPNDTAVGRSSADVWSRRPTHWQIHAVWGSARRGAPIATAIGFENIAAVRPRSAVDPTGW